MFWRGVILCAVVGLLTGCVSDKAGLDYATTAQRLGPPKPGQSRIVVMSEKVAALSLDAAVCDVKIDDGSPSRLKPGTYVYVDRPAGRHQLVATQTFFPGDTKREIATESGRTYFFLARNSERSRALTGMSIMGGLAGALVASAATVGSDNPGPVDLHPLDEASARTTLAGLQLSE